MNRSADTNLLQSSHHLHLKSLVERERREVYQRCNYLSKEWQDRLLQHKIGSSPAWSAFEPSSPSSARCSPQSVMSLSHPESEISVVWRERICEWKFEVVDRFDIDREIVCYSTYYLDQYLSTCYVDEELFQLAAITCIYLAIKLHSPKRVGIHCIASMGRGNIFPDHIAAMELSILQSLEWHLHPATPLAFIDNSFPLLTVGNDHDDNNSSNSKPEAYEFARFLSELSVCAYPFVCVKPSSVAIAASLIAIEHFQLGTKTLETYQGIIKDLGLDMYASDVTKCCDLLRHLYELAVPSNEDDDADTDNSP